ncbi:hypothetical protein CYMTET_11618 [Cymbomonas tetramitiformis]|uniref:Uncharacterized protein n=1 Tax=Cymbomonas tetramitiformis TaxID=36881 RepID=A0AAE0LCZ5_9CHLO|nr:hypothetical protein CYMTET_11618 [Cymbomonas tetramitiformis]
MAFRAKVSTKTVQAVSVGGTATQADDVTDDGEAKAAEKFASLGVDPFLTRALTSDKYDKATDVQVAAIPPILAGENVALQSHTGSGKTLAYLLPLMTRAIAFDRENTQGGKAQPVQLIVVAPSRELAMQITRQAELLVGSERKSLVQQAIGGANPNRQKEGLRRNSPMVVVGTPGRICELSRSGHLGMHQTPLLVLDEVDELQRECFKLDMDRIMQHMGKKVSGGPQTVIVSATLTKDTLTKTAGWCPSPTHLTVSLRGNVHSGDNPIEAEAQRLQDLELPQTLEHLWISTTRRDRVHDLRRAIYAVDAQHALIFMNFGRRLDDTAAKLSARGLKVEALHGGLGKQERQQVLRDFTKGSVRALLTTDVASRGLDMPECDAVFNLELPSDGIDYAHRAGRTGRMGREGIVISCAEPGEEFVVSKIARKLAIDIKDAKVGHGRLKISGDLPDSS